MKTLSKIIGLLISGFMLMSCESDEPSVSGLPTEAQQYFEATVSWVSLSGTAIGPTQAIPSVQRQFRGSGTSNMLSDVMLESTHTELYRGFNSFDIENGQITLIGESGDRIYGVYSGSGSQTYGYTQLNQECKVKGGTGRFSKATGHLAIEVSWLKQAALSTNMTAASIYGTINLNQE